MDGRTDGRTDVAYDNNTKKSFAIKYGKEVNDTEYVLLGQNRINWVDSVKHLGNYVNSQLSDDIEI